MKRLDLAAHPWVRRLLLSRWPQLVVQAGLLAGFGVAILAGLTGSPVGSHNFSIVFVWIAWWALLMLIVVPVLGRGWCSVCPIPLPGEWIQRGSILHPGGAASAGRGPTGRRLLPWPKKWRHIWLQNGAFLTLALFSAVVLTQPRVTGAILAAFIFIALGVSLIFERRSFCRYLCPVGGFIGLYAQVAPVEVRVKDAAVCASHTEKTCYTGGDGGYGCPWLLFPGGLAKNTYCGTCLECLRSCPRDNIAINLRLPGADLDVRAGRKLDEAYKALIMLGSALVYAAVMLGPWGALKAAAYAVGTPAWLTYAAGFLGLVVLGLPGLFWLAVQFGRRASGSALRPRQAFVEQAYALVPLGLAAWVAFSLSFVLANGSYVWPLLSDPLGLGWNLLGTAGAAWTPYLTGWVPALQVGVLAGGLAWACATARRIAAERLAPPAAARQAGPVALFGLAQTLGMLWLLVG